MEESFELKPRDRDGVIAATLLLSPSEADMAMKECGGKKDIVYCCSI